MTSNGDGRRRRGGGGACRSMVGIERRIDLREECKGVGQGRERGKKDKEGGGRGGRGVKRIRREGAGQGEG